MKKAKHGKHSIEEEKSKSNRKINKKIIYALIAILVVGIVVAAIIFGVNRIEGIKLGNIFEQKEVQITTEENKSEEFVKEKEFLGLRFQNISLKRENGITFFSADVTNIAEAKFEEKDVKIIFQNESAEQLASLVTKMKSIEPNETIKFEAATSVDLLNSYTFVIE